MFLNNKQSLYLTGILLLVFFIAGVIDLSGVADLLDNFMIKALIIIGFIAIIVNLILALTNKQNPE